MSVATNTNCSFPNLLTFLSNLIKHDSIENKIYLYIMPAIRSNNNQKITAKNTITKRPKCYI